jgi:hypothetical protein
MAFTLGWQKDRITTFVYNGSTWLWCGTSLLWFCDTVRDSSSNSWKTAMVFGQFLMAFICLIVQCLRD